MRCRLARDQGIEAFRLMDNLCSEIGRDGRGTNDGDAAMRDISRSYNDANKW